MTIAAQAAPTSSRVAVLVPLGIWGRLASWCRDNHIILTSKPPVAGVAQVEMRAAPSKHDTVLTDREYQVLKYVAAGYLYAEIAGLINATTETVSSHMRRVNTKLGTNSQVTAVAEAFRRGFLS